MNSSSIPPERPKNPTHFGGEGLYESAGTEEATAFKAQLGDHLDSATTGSLRAAGRPAGPMLELVRRNPVPVLMALGGLIWFLTSRSRRSDWE